MNAIVAVDKFWGIGKENDLLFDLPKDMAFFRAKTLGKIIVMGSNTLKSFPGGKPLKNRLNIVLWPGGAQRDDCLVVDSLTELLKVLKQYDTNDIFVVGGAMFYKTMLPFCDNVYVTKVDFDGQAEVFFENLDEKENWEETYESEQIEDNNYTIKFCTYSNKKPKNF